MLFAQKAIDHLVTSYPESHQFFGQHQSIEHFATILSFPNWTVVEDAGCWIFAERLGSDIADIHIFCPGGVNIAAVRRVLSKIFYMTGAKTLRWQIPPGHPNERYTRVVSRAVHAQKTKGVYFLTKERHARYSPEDSGTKD